MKLRCGNNSRVRSVRSCGQVETTGKRAPKMKNVSRKWKRKRGGSSKDSLDSNEGQGRSSRRNSPVRSGTHRATTEKSEKRWCKSGQPKCKGSSNLRSGGTKPGRDEMEQEDVTEINWPSVLSMSSRWSIRRSLGKQAWQWTLVLEVKFAMCATGNEKVHEFSVSIEGGRYYMVWVRPEACCAHVTTYHSSRSFAALYSHTAGFRPVYEDSGWGSSTLRVWRQRVHAKAGRDWAVWTKRRSNLRCTRFRLNLPVAILKMLPGARSPWKIPTRSWNGSWTLRRMNIPWGHPGLLRRGHLDLWVRTHLRRLECGARGAKRSWLRALGIWSWERHRIAETARAC